MAQVTGNFSSDYSTLQSMVSATGTNGNELHDFAKAVANEASKSGNSEEATAATNIANSLVDGTYNQQGSEVALSNALEGKGTDSIAVNTASINTQLQNGDTGNAINNMRALAQEYTYAGDTENAAKYTGLADGLEAGAFSASDALSQLTGQTDNSAVYAQLQSALSQLTQAQSQLATLQAEYGGSSTGSEKSTSTTGTTTSSDSVLGDSFSSLTSLLKQLEGNLGTTSA